MFIEIETKLNKRLVNAAFIEQITQDKAGATLLRIDNEIIVIKDSYNDIKTRFSVAGLVVK